MVYGHPLVIHPLEPVGDLIRSAGRVRFSAGIDAWPGGTGEPERKFRGKPGNVIWLVVSTPLKNIWVSCSPDCRHFAGKISFLNSGFPMISENPFRLYFLNMTQSIVEQKELSLPLLIHHDPSPLLRSPSGQGGSSCKASPIGCSHLGQ